jgi:hypothetical protein
MTNETLVKLGHTLLEGSTLFRKVQDVYRAFCSACQTEGVPFKDKSAGVMVVACQAVQATADGAKLWPQKDNKYLGLTNAKLAAKAALAEADSLPHGKKREKAQETAKSAVALLNMLNALSAHLSLFDTYEDLFADNRKQKAPKQPGSKTTKGAGEGSEVPASEPGAIDKQRKADHKTSEAFSIKEHFPEFIAFLMLDGEARKNPDIIAMATALRDIYLTPEETEVKKAA